MRCTHSSSRSWWLALWPTIVSFYYSDESVLVRFAILMSEGFHRVVESIGLHSRLVESVLSVEWVIENVERYESRVAGLTLESPVFGSERGGFNWQLVMNPRNACSSSLVLQLHKSSPVKPASVDYRFGIVNMNGNLEFEDHGQINLEFIAPKQHPTILFNWAQVMDMKHKLFCGDRLRIRCTIETLNNENDPPSMHVVHSTSIDYD